MRGDVERPGGGDPGDPGQARRRHHGRDDEHLTPREREVVQLLSEGQTNARISELLGIAVKTVEAHRISAMRKLGAATTIELVRYALRHRLIEP